MKKKKVMSVIAFLTVAMISGGIVSYAANKNISDTESEVQVESAVTVKAGSESVTQAEVKNVVQTEKTAFTCEVSGCTYTEVHQHGLCGIEGCTLIGEHGHSGCSVAGCTETGVHMHNGEYCYPHRADDGHAYHTCGMAGCTEMGNHVHNSCGVAGCTEMGNHTHNFCGVAGCTQTGEHSHRGNGGCHRSGHGNGHH